MLGRRPSWGGIGTRFPLDQKNTRLVNTKKCTKWKAIIFKPIQFLKLPATVCHKLNDRKLYLLLQALIIKGSSDELELHSLDIPNCGNPCDFYALVSNSQNFTDVDFDAECGSSSFKRSDTQTHLFDFFD